MCHYNGGYDVIWMLKLWDIVLVFVSNEITVEHPLISAQPTTTNTVEYITSPAKQHIPQRRTAAWPGGVERESMAFATMNASPPRNCRMQNAPAGRRYTCRMRNAPAGKGIHRMWKCSIPEGNPSHAKCSTLGRDSLPANFMLK